MPLPLTLPFTLGGPSVAPDSSSAGPAPDWTTAVPSTSGVHPSSTDQTAFTRPEFLNNLPNFIAQFLENFVGTVVKAILGIFIPGDLGSAFSQLSNWAHVLLPEQIRVPIGQLVQLLISGLNLIPIFGPLAGDAVEYLANIFGLLDDNTTVAQSSANTANTGVAELVARLDAGTSGEKIVDTFDRAAASDLGADWTQLYASGAGTRGTDGSGSAVWTPSGAFTRKCVNQHVTLLNTDIQVARFGLTTAGTGGTGTSISLILRVNVAADTYLEAVITIGSCEIGYVVSGTYTRLGSAVSITNNVGDLWEFRAGTGTTGDDRYTFQLLLNGVTVVERVDSGHASQLGASYRQTGWIDYAGQTAFFFAFIQVAPPDLAYFTANDRTP